MSLPPRVLCRTGCGDFGDPELEFLCGDCYSDKVEIDKQKALLEYVQSKKVKNTGEGADGAAPAEVTDHHTRPDSAARRRRPPAIDHRKAFEEFLGRNREKDEQVVARECVFMEREMHIRDTSKLQLRRFMIATDLEEPVDPREWGRYQYGGPRDVPRHDVDSATEMAAQIKLFCNWRRRTVARKIATRRNIAVEQKKTDAEAQKALKKKLKAEKKGGMRLLPKISKPSLSLRSLKTSLSSRALTPKANDTTGTTPDRLSEKPVT